MSPPVAGQVAMHKGQRFECLRVEPYTRKDGQPSGIAVWQSHCAECAEPFTFKRGIGHFRAERRRCEAHASPGKRVR